MDLVVPETLVQWDRPGGREYLEEMYVVIDNNNNGLSSTLHNYTYNSSNRVCLAHLERMEKLE